MTKNKRKNILSPIYYFAVQADSASSEMAIKLFKLAGKINPFNRKLEDMQLIQSLPWKVLVFDYNEDAKGQYTSLVEASITTPLVMNKIDTTKLVSNIVHESFTEDERQSSISRVYFLYPNIKGIDVSSVMKERREQMALSASELKDILEDAYCDTFDFSMPY